MECQLYYLNEYAEGYGPLLDGSLGMKRRCGKLKQRDKSELLIEMGIRSEVICLLSCVPY